jgi:hypothetical protein
MSVVHEDGGSAHSALSVRAWLDNSFPGSWTGRRGHCEFLLRSWVVSLRNKFETLLFILTSYVKAPNLCLPGCINV